MNISGTTMNIDDLTIDGKSIKTLKSRLEAISADNAVAHNSVCRGKNLGTSITAAQLATIRQLTFNDLYVGDYWVFSIDGNTVRALIVGFNFTLGSAGAIVLLTCPNWRFPFNDTDDCSGGLANSTLQNEIFPQLLAEINKVIPDDHIANPGVLISDAVNDSGAATHFVVTNTKLLLTSPYNIGLPQAIPSWNSNTAYQDFSFTRWPLCNFGQIMTANEYDGWLAFSASKTSWGVKSTWRPLTSAVKVTTPRNLSPYLIIR